jgi:MFS family permease
MYRPTEDESAPSVALPADRPITALIPIMAVVLVAFLIIGLALPVLPLHVHERLGFGTFVVGLVTGCQFGASLLSRMWAGHYADRRGPKRAIIVGLLVAVVAGLLYIASLRFVAAPLLSVTILLAGRALLGGAESFIITGAMSWGLTRAGAENAGRVIAWMGMALYAALALGAPLGTALYSFDGFAAVAIVATLIPLVTVLLVAPLSPVPPTQQHGTRPSVTSVTAAVWLPGFGSALSSIGMGALLTFGSLLSVQRGWSPVWLVFGAFALALVAARLFLGHVSDRLGGAKVALACALIEAAGLALIALAPGPLWAALGAALTGIGYGLIYPGLGVEAVRRTPPQSRGLAMGAYSVFLDIALGVSGPALGLIAGRFSLGAAFLISALIALGAAAVALRLLLAGPSESK